MAQKLDIYEKYQEVISEKRKPTKKMVQQLSRFRFCFAMVCEGWSIMMTAKQLMKNEEADGNVISESQAAKIVKDSLYIFGKADEHMKAGLKYASYEYLMRLAKKAEKKEDFATARLLVSDANKLMGLDQISDGGIENPQDYMQPEAFVIMDNPKFLDVANKVMELEWSDANVVKDEEDEEDD